MPSFNISLIILGVKLKCYINFITIKVNSKKWKILTLLNIHLIIELTLPFYPVGQTSVEGDILNSDQGPTNITRNLINSIGYDIILTKII